MEAVSSGRFLDEFTVIAERANDEGERFIIQRKNVVLLSMEDFNDMQRKIYEAQKRDD